MFRLFILTIILCLCGCKANNTYDTTRDDRSRFMSENRHAVRILSLDDEDYKRVVKVEGIISKEQTWAFFKKNQVPEVGQIWNVGLVTDGDTVWLSLTDFPVVIK
jgi:hypothetical protein